MAQLPLTNVINISVATSQTGVNAYNTSNLAIFSDDAPAPSVETLTFSAVAASGAFVLTFSGHATASINWNDTLSAIQAKINAVTGMGNVTLTGSVGGDLITMSQPGQFGAIPLAVVSTNTLQTAGSANITLTPVVTATGWSGGALGYAIYLTPTQVGLDFGTTSRTYLEANAIFSQQPNILGGGGALIVILMTVAQQTLTFSGIAASGAFVATYNANNSASIAWNSTPSQIQAILRAVPGLEQVQVTGSIASLTLTILMNGVYGPGLSLGSTSNTLQTAGSASITITQASTVIGETIGAAITRTQGLVQYFGILPVKTLAIIGQTDLLVAAAIIQALNVIGVFVSYNTADIAPGGMIDLLRSGGFTQTRGLYYGDSSSSGVNALVMSAAYAGRAFSTNFSGSNTTQTMNLKPLTGIQPDPTMTQTILTEAGVAGADTYVSLAGVSAVICVGANSYFDQVYNLQWFVGALQVAGFNYLAQSSTKIPQTENGMDGLKGAYRAICEQAITNQYLAPGVWNSPNTFGNPADLIANVAQRGYYIYSLPIGQQLQTARAARQAPLVQIAIKQAGAIQTSSVIVNVNA